uniref:Tyrosine-protein phosphatase non-receptor type 13-like n=1 Tax=Diabrotica virgifera virgifera TaxID=50390 RepID=A0A6P7FCV1_DIAVI
MSKVLEGKPPDSPPDDLQDIIMQVTDSSMLNTHQNHNVSTPNSRFERQGNSSQSQPEKQKQVFKTDTNSENFGTIPRRWMGLSRNHDSCLPKITKEASTSMEDLSFTRQLFHVPGTVVRPKSMYVADSDRPNSEINVISDNIFFNKHLSEQKFESETVSKGLASGTTNNKGINTRRLKVRRNPVQRAASRLYRVNSKKHIGDTPRECVGPEFVVRASLLSKQLTMPDVKTSSGRTLTIIMLNGQKLDVLCHPSSTTAGQLFELIIQKEHIEENFMFGLSALISGDFVFLPSDTRISKIFQEELQQGTPITLFMRVRFFLPTLRGFRGNESRHLLYLQLRRSIIEHQLPCSFKQIVELNGLALQAEFGNYNTREHGQRDYFLLEHYIPESMSSAIENTEKLRQELIQAHVLKHGMDGDKAEESFISLAQSLPHYGGHFYTATWIMKDGNHKDIWLYISAQGMNMYERGKNTSHYGPHLYEKFEWRNIQTLCYSKQYLCILPHSNYESVSKLKKYKLKMDQKNFVSDSTLKQTSQLFLPNFQETISESLQEKLNNFSFVEERMLFNVSLQRENGSFGLQITEGSDGNVYIQSVIEGGPAHLKANVQRGDQIIAVNKKSLLGLKYNEALDILKSAGQEIQFVLARNSQNLTKTKSVSSILSKNELQLGHSYLCDSPVEKHVTESCRDISNVSKYGRLSSQTEVPYHKHIRYKIEPETDSFMSNKDFPTRPSLSRSLSKSCTNLYSSDNDKAIVVEMIPKEHIDLSNINSLDRKTLREDMTKVPIAMPRSLGVSRRWRGPVKYPVTPIKKLSQLNDSTYLSTSDEEQVFI